MRGNPKRRELCLQRRNMPRAVQEVAVDVRPGFTLVELLVAVSVIAVILTLLVPEFRDQWRNWKLVPGRAAPMQLRSRCV